MFRFKTNSFMFKAHGKTERITLMSFFFVGMFEITFEHFLVLNWRKKSTQSVQLRKKCFKIINKKVEPTTADINKVIEARVTIL